MPGAASGTHHHAKMCSARSRQRKPKSPSISLQGGLRLSIWRRSRPGDRRRQGAARGKPPAGRAAVRRRQARGSARVRAQWCGQRLLMIEDEKRLQQISLDKINAEAARLIPQARRDRSQLDGIAGPAASRGGQFCRAEYRTARLANALDEANERREHEITTQRMRFDALQARATASEKLLGEAREHLLARADEIRTYDRRAPANLRWNVTACRRAWRISKANASSASPNSRNVDQARATLVERTVAPRSRLYRQGSWTISASNYACPAAQPRFGNCSSVGFPQRALSRWPSEANPKSLGSSAKRRAAGVSSGYSRP